MGKVYLVGAGPGNKGLLTLRGAEVISIADVIIYDRLVGRDILDMVPCSAEKINVGKDCGHHPIPQEQINKLIYDRALKNNTVVRLKGGDPFLFGRGGEELELLVENNISFEIVPGVSSALSVPAYAGIPVTHRDYSSSLHIFTGHTCSTNSLDFENIARLKGTLVFLMSVSNCKYIIENLLSAGMDENIYTSVIENGTNPEQRSFTCKLKELDKLILANNIKPPSIIIIGSVCSLSESYAWYLKQEVYI